MISVTFTCLSAVNLQDGPNGPVLSATLLKGRLRASCEEIAQAFEWRVCRPPEHSCRQSPCIVCQVFGSPWREGTLYFRNLTTTALPAIEARGGVPRSWSRGVARQPGHETQYRLIPVGTQFVGEMINVTQNPALIAFVLVGLRSITTLGSGKTMGFGSVRVEAEARDTANRPLNDQFLATALRTFRP